MTADASGAVAAIDRLKELGIDINVVCAKLLKDGLAQFENSFDSLLKAIARKKRGQALNVEFVSGCRGLNSNFKGMADLA